jgi:hypothetical protein
MDVHDEYSAPVRCVPYQCRACVRAGVLDLRGRVDAFYERVVGFWEHKVGYAVGISRVYC